MNMLYRYVMLHERVYEHVATSLYIWIETVNTHIYKTVNIYRYKIHPQLIHYVLKVLDIGQSTEFLDRILPPGKNISPL